MCQEKIRGYLNEHGPASVGAVAQALNMSEDTVKHEMGKMRQHKEIRFICYVKLWDIEKKNK